VFDNLLIAVITYALIAGVCACLRACTNNCARADRTWMHAGALTLLTYRTMYSIVLVVPYILQQMNKVRAHTNFYSQRSQLNVKRPSLIGRMFVVETLKIVVFWMLLLLISIFVAGNAQFLVETYMFM
jgi:Ca2+/H+ antiporter